VQAPDANIFRALQISGLSCFLQAGCTGTRIVRVFATVNQPISKAMLAAARVEFARLGGIARGKKVTKKRLREIAMMGVRARAAKRNGS
jgi:hypothetical protein